MDQDRGHTPYGYRIANGIAVVCEEQADQLRRIYKGYLEGLSMTAAASEAGLKLTHSSVKRMLQNKRYLGDDFYPAIIDRETFDAFETERVRREKALGRDDRQKKTVNDVPAPISFTMKKAEYTFQEPYRQAEYLYSLIEIKESED